MLVLFISKLLLLPLQRYCVLVLCGVVLLMLLLALEGSVLVLSGIVLLLLLPMMVVRRLLRGAVLRERVSHRRSH